MRDFEYELQDTRCAAPGQYIEGIVSVGRRTVSHAASRRSVCRRIGGAIPDGHRQSFYKIRLRLLQLDKKDERSSVVSESPVCVPAQADGGVR